MEMPIWILFCFFASIGLVQCGIWVADSFKSTKNPRRCYYVIPLYDNAEKLEAQIRYSLSQIRWIGLGGGFIVFVDMGLGEESRKICNRLLADTTGIYICAKAELTDALTRLDELQMEQSASR